MVELLAEANIDTKIADLLTEDSLTLILVFGCGTIIALVSVVFGTIKRMVISKEREATKRELAAYVAEGTLDPDKAVAILESDKPAWERPRQKNLCC